MELGHGGEPRWACLASGLGPPLFLFLLFSFSGVGLSQVGRGDVDGPRAPEFGPCGRAPPFLLFFISFYFLFYFKFEFESKFKSVLTKFSNRGTPYMILG